MDSIRYMLNGVLFTGLCATALQTHASVIINYTYDDLNRVTASYRATGFMRGYSYDEVGNITAMNPDSDEDGLIDLVELHFFATDPNDADSDGDGLTDYQEAC